MAWHEMPTLRPLNSSGDVTELELPSTGIFTAQSGELVALADQWAWTGSSGGE